MKIGDKIAKLRDSLGFSQEDFGERIGVGRNYLSRIENGHVNPTYDTLEKIAAGLGGRFDFIAEKGPEEPPRPADNIGPLSQNEKVLVLAYREIPTNDKRRAAMMVVKNFGK